MVIRTFMVLAVVAVLGDVAAAENQQLIAARAAIQGVRYDEAQALLVAALEVGRNSPSSVTEIYRLSASTAIVLNQRELAEQYYRRWLALDPAASLPEDVAPKLREPFIAAQAYMNAHGRLSAKATRTSASTVTVIVETDPLGMAAGAVALGPPTTFDADHHATLDVGTANSVFVVDEHGNQLVELVIAPQVAIGPGKAPGGRTRVSVFRNGRLWTVASAVTLAGGAVFGVLAGRANSEVTTLAVATGTRTLADYEAARDRRDRHALVANGLFIAGGVFAVTAAIMFVTAPERPTVVTPSATGTSVGVTVTRAF